MSYLTFTVNGDNKANCRSVTEAFCCSVTKLNRHIEFICKILHDTCLSQIIPHSIKPVLHIQSSSSDSSAASFLLCLFRLSFFFCCSTVHKAWPRIPVKERQLHKCLFRLAISVSLVYFFINSSLPVSLGVMPPWRSTVSFRLFLRLSADLSTCQPSSEDRALCFSCIPLLFS